jgi:hypothetical protein
MEAEGAVARELVDGVRRYFARDDASVGTSRRGADRW